MAKSDGTVYVNTLIDTKGFGKGVNTMQKQIGGLSGAIGKLGAVIAATFAVGKLIQFGKEAINLGSDLQEVQNVVDVTFTTMNEQVNEFARNAAEAAGLSETMAKRYTGTFGAMAKAFGFAEGEAFDMSTSLTQLAGDVASFYNITQDEAYTKLKSVFTGETETLKDLGVVMTQNALDAFAMAKGYGKTTKQMSEQEKVALRYAFVLDQLSAAQGDFVRTSDSWANQTRILSLNFDSFKANIGQALINIFTPFLKIINQIVSKMAQLSSHFVAFSELLVGKSTSGGGGSPGDSLGEIESGYEDIADATDEATKAQNKYLTGLDEIKTFASDIGEGNGTSLDADIITKPEDTIMSDKTANTMVSGLVERLKKIFADENWAGLGTLLSDGIVLGLNTLADKIKTIDWDGIGRKIGQFLKDIKWGKILLSVGNFMETLLVSGVNLLRGVFDANPLAGIIVTALGVAHFTGLSSILRRKISQAVPTSISLGKTLFITFAAVELGVGAGKSLTKYLFDRSNKLFGTNYDFSKYEDWGFTDFLIESFNQIPAVLENPLFYPEAFVKIVFGYDSLEEWWQAGIDDFVSNAKLEFDNVKTIINTAISKFLEEKIKPLFSKEKWAELLYGAGASFGEWWSGIVNWWDEELPLWWKQSVVPWLSKDKWLEELNNVKEALSDAWDDSFGKWGEDISTWFEEDVKPWLSKEKWQELGQSMKEGLYNGFKTVVTSIIDLLNELITGAENGINSFIGGINKFIEGYNSTAPAGFSINTLETVSFGKIPYPKLATGAVIPPNAPFMAMLGDQKHGTNIEAPLDTIKQAVREVVGNGNSGGQYAFTAQINRRTLFEEMIDEAKLRQSTSGRNPFDLA